MSVAELTKQDDIVYCGVFLPPAITLVWKDTQVYRICLGLQFIIKSSISTLFLQPPHVRWMAGGNETPGFMYSNVGMNLVSIPFTMSIKRNFFS